MIKTQSSTVEVSTLDISTVEVFAVEVSAVEGYHCLAFVFAEKDERWVSYLQTVYRSVLLSRQEL